MKIFKILAIILFFSFFKTYSMELITINSDSIKQANKKLKEAILSRSFEKAEEAIKEGADVNFKFRLDETRPIEVSRLSVIQAARMICPDIVKLLVEHGARTLDGKDNLLFEINYMSPSSYELLKFLVKFGVDISARGKGMVTGSLIYHAIFYLIPDILRFILYEGIDLGVEKGGDIVVGMDYSLIVYASRILTSFDDKKDTVKLRNIVMMLGKHAARMNNVKNKSLKDIVQKVNQLIKSKIDNDFLPTDLKNLVLGYVLYPTDSEEFFNLPDEQIDELIKVYSEEFEKEEAGKKIEEESQSKCIVM